MSIEPNGDRCTACIHPTCQRLKMYGVESCREYHRLREGQAIQPPPTAPASPRPEWAVRREIVQTCPHRSKRVDARCGCQAGYNCALGYGWADGSVPDVTCFGCEVTAGRLRERMTRETK